jgi:hypothetical protein
MVKWHKRYRQDSPWPHIRPHFNRALRQLDAGVDEISILQGLWVNLHEGGDRGDYRVVALIIQAEHARRKMKE